jgi:hypothetical protein
MRVEIINKPMLYMEKLIKIALEAKGFKPEMVEAIIKVANATQNPVVAIEIILGIYEMPIIPETSTHRNEAKLISFDPLANENYSIRFSYLEENIKPSKWDRDTMSRESAIKLFKSNPEEWVNYTGNNYDYTSVGIGTFQKTEDSTSLKRWLNSPKS